MYDAPKHDRRDSRIASVLLSYGKLVLRPLARNRQSAGPRPRLSPGPANGGRA
jgi:hypothetical protein